MAECSVIIVTYNGLNENTIPCLESIFRETEGEDYEVVVVDNNSTDGTPAYLKQLASQEPRLKPVFNSTNRGFAGGNNDGLRLASGNVIVCLNSDTQVTSRWLTRLRTVLQSDKSIGLLGPVTNSVGNEQKIYTSGTTPLQILTEGIQWTRNAAGAQFETERLGFFCVAFRRELFEKVGGLDEAFGLGFYEDDDFCVRVRRAGYRLVCCEDVFVYHQGSASFNKMPFRTKELLKKNLCLLEHKHAMRYNPRHPRDRQLDLIQNYLSVVINTENKTLLRCAENRLMLAKQLMPHSFFKKIIYCLHVCKLEYNLNNCK